MENPSLFASGEFPRILQRACCNAPRCLHPFDRGSSHLATHNPAPSPVAKFRLTAKFLTRSSRFVHPGGRTSKRWNVHSSPNGGTWEKRTGPPSFAPAGEGSFTRRRSRIRVQSRTAEESTYIKIRWNKNWSLGCSTPI